MGNGRTPETGLMIRLAGIGFALYSYYQIVQAYLKGGEEAPSLLFLIISGVLLVGGAIAVGVMAYRLYKQDKATQEEAARIAAQQVTAEEEEDDDGNTED